MLNDVIIFSLQRLNTSLSSKNTISVAYSENISLKEFCDRELCQSENNYKLFCTINHYGDINFGHYYSYIKIGNKWYQFNDSYVNEISQLNTNSSSVCVLFYEKVI